MVARIVIQKTKTGNLNRSMLLRLERRSEGARLVICKRLIFNSPTRREFCSDACASCVIDTKFQEPDVSL